MKKPSSNTVEENGMNVVSFCFKFLLSSAITFVSLNLLVPDVRNITNAFLANSYTKVSQAVQNSQPNNREHYTPIHKLPTTIKRTLKPIEPPVIHENNTKKSISTSAFTNPADMKTIVTPDRMVIAAQDIIFDENAKDQIITGHIKADNYIRKIAEKRGYKRVKVVDEASLKQIGAELLNPKAIEAFIELQTEASKDGIYFRIVSGYRSPKIQKEIFMDKLGKYTLNQILSGDADTAINNILNTSSIPGYSRHHTGRALDLVCDGGTLGNFTGSPCDLWLQKNNYELPRKHGFVPSYPSGVSFDQGPKPESWEFTYILNAY